MSTDEVPVLRFIGPTIMPTRGGTGASVRLGNTWYHRVAPGDEIALSVCQLRHGGDCREPACEDLGRATVMQTWSGPAHLLPAALLEYQTDPLCRSYAMLLRRLSELYLEHPVVDDTVVTVMVFMRQQYP